MFTQRLSFFLLMLSAALIFSSCATVQKKVERKKIPPYQPTNVWTVGKLSYQFKRVALLPIYYEDRQMNKIDEFDQIFRAELSKQNSFEVRSLSREEMDYIFGKEHFSSVGELPQNLLQKLYDEYGVDGLILTDITEYNPYTPISVGVRSKLVHVQSGEVIWSFDNTYDGGSRAVQLAIEDFHHLEDRNVKPGHVLTGGILQSPRQFAKFVASSTYKTIPQR